MTIDVLVCYPDGTQRVEKREVPDDWFDTTVGEVAPNIPPSEEN